MNRARIFSEEALAEETSVSNFEEVAVKPYSGHLGEKCQRPFKEFGVRFSGAPRFTNTESR